MQTQQPRSRFAVVPNTKRLSPDNTTTTSSGGMQAEDNNTSYLDSKCNFYYNISSDPRFFSGFSADISQTEAEEEQDVPLYKQQTTEADENDNHDKVVDARPQNMFYSPHREQQLQQTSAPQITSSPPYTNDGNNRIKRQQSPVARRRSVSPEQGVGGGEGVRLESSGGGGVLSAEQEALVSLMNYTANLPIQISHQPLISLRKKPKVNYAKQKWEEVSFKDPESIKFREQLTQSIIEQRRAYGKCKCKIDFPEKVPDEALDYSMPQHGLGWELFDATKHVDYDTQQRAEEKKQRREQAIFGEDGEKFNQADDPTPLWSFDDQNTTVDGGERVPGGSDVFVPRQGYFSSGDYRNPHFSTVNSDSGPPPGDLSYYTGNPKDSVYYYDWSKTKPVTKQGKAIVRHQQNQILMATTQAADWKNMADYQKLKEKNMGGITTDASSSMLMNSTTSPGQLSSYAAQVAASPARRVQPSSQVLLSEIARAHRQRRILNMRSLQPFFASGVREFDAKIPANDQGISWDGLVEAAEDL